MGRVHEGRALNDHMRLGQGRGLQDLPATPRRRFLVLVRGVGLAGGLEWTAVCAPEQGSGWLVSSSVCGASCVRTSSAGCATWENRKRRVYARRPRKSWHALPRVAATKDTLSTLGQVCCT